MDVREERGLRIAANAQIRRVSGAWIVPSQSDQGAYRVALGQDGEPHCSCPDHELRRQPCKHMIAVGIVVQRQTVTERITPDGERITTTTTEIVAARLSYPQPSWHNYNAAQCAEKEIAQ